MEYVILIAFFIAVGIWVFRYKENNKKKESTIYKIYAKNIIPDTGNFEKVVNRIIASENFKQEYIANRSAQNNYTFTDITLIFRGGGECHRLVGVTFKGVDVPLGTEEMKKLDLLSMTIINEKKEIKRELEEKEVNRILATL